MNLIKEKKHPVKSKTLIASAALPLLTLIPGVKDVIVNHPQESSAAVGLLFAGLRMLTGKNIGF